MKRRKQPTPPNWLRAGIRVDYSSVIGEQPTEHDLVVRTDPQQMASGHWVVWLEGKAGCVSVEAVRPAGPSVIDKPCPKCVRPSPHNLTDDLLSECRGCGHRWL